MSQRPPLRSKRLVARTEVTEILPPTCERMFSVQVTQARVPATRVDTSLRLKRISAVFLKIASQDARIASRPMRSVHPGWTHLTCSPLAQTAYISARARLSNAR
jgi:hypothetical protein